MKQFQRIILNKASLKRASLPKTEEFDNVADYDAKAHHPSASEFALVGSRDCFEDLCTWTHQQHKSIALCGGRLRPASPQ